MDSTILTDALFSQQYYIVQEREILVDAVLSMSPPKSSLVTHHLDQTYQREKLPLDLHKASLKLRVFGYVLNLCQSFIP